MGKGRSQGSMNTTSLRRGQKRRGDGRQQMACLCQRSGSISHPVLKERRFGNMGGGLNK